MGVICTVPNQHSATGSVDCDPLSKFALHMKLIEAGHKGDVILLQKLLKDGANINASDRYGRTALHLASAEGHSEAVRFLVMKGAKVDVEDCRGCQPLEEAVRRRHKWVIDVLKEAGARMPSEWKFEMRTKLFNCAAKNDLMGIARILDQGICINSTDYMGQTALHIAVEHKARAVVDYLIRSGIDINLSNSAGHTALAIALKNDDKVIQAVLYAAGAVEYREQDVTPTLKPCCTIDDDFPHRNNKQLTIVSTEILFNFADQDSGDASSEAAAERRSIFRDLDRLVSMHGMLKVDCIGAVYIASTAVSEDTSPQHAAVAVAFALDALGSSAAAPLRGPAAAEVRVGVHSATVPACRAGASVRFAQRSWLCDAVRAAGAVAHAAGPGQLLCSAATVELIARVAPEMAATLDTCDSVPPAVGRDSPSRRPSRRRPEKPAAAGASGPVPARGRAGADAGGGGDLLVVDCGDAPAAAAAAAAGSAQGNGAGLPHSPAPPGPEPEAGPGERWR